MRPLLQFSALTLGLLLPAGILSAQTLWPGTTAGLSLEEVRKLYPGAHEPEKAIVLPAGRGVELLVLDETEIAGRQFKVEFFFKAERLVHVSLFAIGEINEKEFERFRDLLRAKYNQEYSTTSSETIQVRWNAVQTVILLTWIPVGRENSSMEISYQAPIPKETDRL
jgi:hypothetical protein